MSLFRSIFPKYEYLEDDIRRKSNGTIQGYCAELCGWYDIDYLAGTSYDGCYWLRKSLEQINGRDIFKQADNATGSLSETVQSHDNESSVGERRNSIHSSNSRADIGADMNNFVDNERMNKDIITHRDGSYMNYVEVFFDIVNKNLLDAQTRLVVGSNFQWLTREEHDLFVKSRFHAGYNTQQVLYRWIRNSYGMWNPDNPHTLGLTNTMPEELKSGSLNNPDNYSDLVMQLLITYYKRTYELEINK